MEEVGVLPTDNRHLLVGTRCLTKLTMRTPRTSSAGRRRSKRHFWSKVGQECDEHADPVTNLGNRSLLACPPAAGWAIAAGTIGVKYVAKLAARTTAAEIVSDW